MEEKIKNLSDRLEKLEKKVSDTKTELEFIQHKQDLKEILDKHYEKKKVFNKTVLDTIREEIKKHPHG